MEPTRPAARAWAEKNLETGHSEVHNAREHKLSPKFEQEQGHSKGHSRQGAISGPDLQWADTITLRGISATGYHGVYDHERQNGQPFNVDVTMWVNTQAAAVRDDLALTVDYSRVAQAIVDVIAGQSVWLIERLAEQVAAAVLTDFPVRAVQVTVHKPQAPLEMSFTDVQVQILRTPQTIARDINGPDAPLLVRPVSPREIVLALGANLGDPVNTLRAVVAQLRGLAELDDVRVSPLARTQAVLAPDQPPQPDYYNAVVLAQSRLSATEILGLAHRLENQHGRVRDERWGARTLDVDVIQIAGLTSDNATLTLPHPRAATRAFVLRPWAALDPGATLNGQSVGELAAVAADRDGVQRLWPQWLEAPSATGTLPALAPAGSGARAAGTAGAEAPGPLSLPSWQAALHGGKPRIVDSEELDIITDTSGESDGGRAANSLSGPGEGEALPKWRSVRRKRGDGTH